MPSPPVTSEVTRWLSNLAKSPATAQAAGMVSDLHCSGHHFGIRGESHPAGSSRPSWWKLPPVLKLYVAQLQIFQLYLKVIRRSCIRGYSTLVQSSARPALLPTEGPMPCWRPKHWSLPPCHRTLSLIQKSYFVHSYERCGSVSWEFWAESPKKSGDFGAGLPVPRGVHRTLCCCVVTLPSPHLQQDLRASPRCNSDWKY